MSTLSHHAQAQTSDKFFIVELANGQRLRVSGASESGIPLIFEMDVPITAGGFSAQNPPLGMNAAAGERRTRVR